MVLGNKKFRFILLGLCFVALAKISAAKLENGGVGVCSKKIIMNFSEYWLRKKECSKMTNESACLDKLEKERSNEIKVCCRGYLEKDGQCEPQCSKCVQGRCLAPNKCEDCAVNFGGANCNETCTPGRFGLNCEHNCDCINDRECRDGYSHCDCHSGSEHWPESCWKICKCEVSCEDGLIGKNCDIKCPKNTYGKYCSKNCDCDAHGTQECDAGQCRCKSSFYGTRCENKCKDLLICENDSKSDCKCGRVLEEQIDLLNEDRDKLAEKVVEIRAHLENKIDNAKNHFEQLVKTAEDHLEQRINELKSSRDNLEQVVDENKVYLERIVDETKHQIMHFENSLKIMKKANKESKLKIHEYLGENFVLERNMAAHKIDERYLDGVQNVERYRDFLRIAMLVLTVSLFLCLLLIYKYKTNNSKLKSDLKVDSLRYDESNRFNNLKTPISKATLVSMLDNYVKPIADTKLSKMIKSAKNLGLNRPEKLFKQEKHLGNDMTAGRQEAILNIYTSIDKIRYAAEEQKIADTD